MKYVPTQTYAMARCQTAASAKGTGGVKKESILTPDIATGHEHQTQQLERLEPVIGTDGVAEAESCGVFARLAGWDA